MFYFAVFEEDSKKRADIKSILLKYAFRADLEISTLWFTEADAVGKLSRYSLQIQVALISLDCPGNAAIGQQLYQENPDCMICYYSAKTQALEPLLSSRPLCYYQADCGEPLLEKIDRMVSDYIRRIPIFQYSTRKTHFYVPIRSIVYFQSDLKHVNISYVSGKTDSLFGKLSDVEDTLNKSCPSHGFIRCHKSYLVNLLYIEKLDKASSFLYLNTGDLIPVSKIQYPKVLQRLSLMEDALTKGSADSSV